MTTDPSPIRVLLVYHGAALAASRRLFEALAKHDDIRLRVLAPRRGYDALRETELTVEPYRADGYELVTGDLRHADRDITGPYARGLLREMIRYRPHVAFVMNEVFTNMYMQALVYRRLALSSAKVLFYGFENILIDKPRTKKQRLRWGLLRKWCDGGAYANTEGLDKVAALGVGKGNLSLTYWGVPIDDFQPAADRRERITDNPTVGYIGRMCEEKGLPSLLEAMSRLGENVHLLCVGGGPWREPFDRQVKRRGLQDRVHCVSQVGEGQVPRYLHAMDALVLPSRTTSTWKEQFGRVLVEAMACGVPVVGSDSGAIPEVIGDAGLTFAEGDGEALARTLQNLLADEVLRASLGDRGRRRALKEFSCDAFADRLVDLFHRSTR